jgi:hypothetical protein
MDGSKKREKNGTPPAKNQAPQFAGKELEINAPNEIPNLPPSDRCGNGFSHPAMPCKNCQK